jgi:hypothetical protein
MPVADEDDYAGFSPAETVKDTEAVYGAMGSSPGSPGTAVNQESIATQADTSGTSVAGIGAALPGGSATDTIPWSGSGQLGGMTGPGMLQGNSGYAVSEVVPGQYGTPLGSPDTEGVYGGTPGTAPVTAASPYPWLPSSTALTGTLDTQVGLGSDLVPSMYPSPNAYRPPSAYVAGSVKDTTLTDILGNQVTAAPLTDASYSAVNIDTSYIGAPAAPSALLSQKDAFSSTAIATPYYLSKRGIFPATVVVTDTTASVTLVLNTDYTLTYAGNGPRTAGYITLTAGTNYTAGDSISVAYSYGDSQYFDSNLPAAQNLTVTDVLQLSQVPAQLLAWGVVTAAASITVFDVTKNVSLTYNTDYTVAKVTAPYTPGADYTETPAITYAITRIPTSTACAWGDVINVTYQYSTSVPGAPSVGSTLSQTDTISSFTSTPSALSQTGIVTPPASMTVADTTNGKTLVMNLDYTVTISGSGSSLTYSVARLSGSTNSTSTDHVTVTYRYGTAAYFAAGPVLPMNRGALVPWAPPSGITEVDYYLLQTNTLGTMYVPATGQPGLYGQPSPSGGADSGQPVYQTDQFTLLAAAISPPSAPTLAHAGTGGTVLAGTYQAIITYVNANGETLGSSSASVTTTGSTSTLTVDSPSAATGATGWNAYLTQVGGSTFTKQNATPVAIATNLVLTAPPTSTGAAPPVLNTTLPTLTKTGVLTAAGQLIVKDLTSTQQDPLQPTGTVLEYGYDYTVTQVGVGPWETFQIALVTSSVNAKSGDTITVGYWYDQMGAFPLSAAADTVTAVSKVAALLHQDVAISLSQLIVYDTTISKPLAYGLDFTVGWTGEGPVQSVSVTLITTGPAGAGATDVLKIYYLYGIVPAAWFTQGLLPNASLIYKPSGATYAQAGYQFQVAAGNRAGLGPFSAWSDFVIPLNYNAPQPGHEGSTQTGLGTLDPSNSVNPIYLPSGAIKAGTGLGV